MLNCSSRLVGMVLVFGFNFAFVNRSRFATDHAVEPKSSPIIPQECTPIHIENNNTNLIKKIRKIYLFLNPLIELLYLLIIVASTKVAEMSLFRYVQHFQKKFNFFRYWAFSVEYFWYQTKRGGKWHNSDQNSNSGQNSNSSHIFDPLKLPL